VKILQKVLGGYFLTHTVYACPIWSFSLQPFPRYPWRSLKIIKVGHVTPLQSLLHRIMSASA